MCTCHGCEKTPVEKIGSSNFLLNLHSHKVQAVGTLLPLLHRSTIRKPVGRFDCLRKIGRIHTLIELGDLTTLINSAL